MKAYKLFQELMDAREAVVAKESELLIASGWQQVPASRDWWKVLDDTRYEVPASAALYLVTRDIEECRARDCQVNCLTAAFSSPERKDIAMADGVDDGSAAMLGSLDAMKGVDAGPEAAKHDGLPEPKAQLPNTVHAGCRSRESDAGTGALLDEIATLSEEVDRLRLTETERLAIDWAAVCAATQSQVAVHKTLRKLLERHK